MSSISLETLRNDYMIANGIQNKSQLVAFHLKNYVITTAVESLKAQRAQGKDTSELMKEVQNWFQDLENLKTTLGSQVQNKDQGRKQFSDYSLSLFKKANDQYKSGAFSQQLAEELATVNLLFEAYSIFGSSSQEIDSNKPQAKSAHQAVLQALAGNKFSSSQHTPQGNPYASHNTSHIQSLPPFANQNDSTFPGFQAAESVFVSKTTIDQKKSAITNPQQQSQVNQSMHQNQPQNQSQNNAFSGFQVAESTFIPQSSLEQKRSMANNQSFGQQQPGTGSVNPYDNNQFPNFSMYHQQPPTNFNPYNMSQHQDFNQGQFGAQPIDNNNFQNPMSNSKNMSQSVTGQNQGNISGLPDFTKFTDANNTSQANPYQTSMHQNIPQNVGMSQNPYQNPSQNNIGMSQNPNNQNQGWSANPYTSTNNNPYMGNQGFPEANNTPQGNLPGQGYLGQSQGGNRMQEEKPQNLPKEEKKEEGKPVINRANFTRGGNEGKNINLPSDKQAELRELCMMAISELDYKNVEQAKADIRKALSIVKDLM